MTEAARSEAFERIPDEFKQSFACIEGASQRCEGRDGRDCIFGAGGQKFQTHFRARQCIFCDVVALRAECNNAGGLQRVANLMDGQTGEAQDAVFARLAPSAAREIHHKLLGLQVSSDPSDALVTVQQQAAYKNQWRRFLSARAYTSAGPSCGQERRWRQQVLENRAYAKRKMQVEGPRHKRNASVDNDSGLPLPTHSTFAKQLYNWNVNNSWCLCQECDSLILRPLTEKSLTSDMKMTASWRECTNCSAANPIWLPTAEDVPDALKGLSAEQAAALSPLEMDVGPETRANEGGYRIKMGMVRFSWSERSVPHQIVTLPPELRQGARRAYDFLLQSEASAYRVFVADHDAFLWRHPGADARKRRRRYEFIENVGLECALWPDLFWDVTLTYTYERSTDTRRAGTEDGEQRSAAFATNTGAPITLLALFA